MKTTSKLTTILFALIIVLIASLLFDFLALHDISNDYVSTPVIRQFSSVPASNFPEWTKNSGEWSLIRWSLAVKLIIAALSIPIVWALRRNYDMTR